MAPIWPAVRSTGGGRLCLRSLVSSQEEAPAIRSGWLVAGAAVGEDSAEAPTSCAKGF